MGTIMIRGASAGRVAEVEDKALLARPHSAFDQAIIDGDAYSWLNATYDYAANDTILGVENNSTDKDLYIERILITGSTATQYVVFSASAATMAGTAVTGVNLNRGNNNIADATAKGDETGNAEQAAGYTAALLTGRFANNGNADIQVGGAIVLPNDHMIGVDFTTDGTTCNVTIWGYFK